MSERLIFKPRARLLRQLGDQLIRNESIALLELVKNSYDADASYSKVEIKSADTPEKGEIIVEDDGCGMTADVIKNVWMEPGSNYKQELFKKRTRSPKYGRLPLGEKGIGRFAVHKLGNVIELITRSKNSKEVYLKIDWRMFLQSKYLNEVPVEITEREPIIYKDGTGTRIIIRDLKNRWTRGMTRELYRSINSFCSPFGTLESFRVKFEIDKEEWLKGLLSWKEIEKYALYSFYCEIKGNHVGKLRYEFTPWPTMTKIRKRVVDDSDENVKKMLRMVDKSDEINLDRFKIGPVKFEGLIFDRDPKILKLGIQDKEGLKKYIDKNGGIRVYRNGIRVYDYGEPGNDWLGLDIRRVNAPTMRVSNNIIISAVTLQREESLDLIEKTNREGFIENEAFEELKKALLYSLSRIEIYRNEDKDTIRKMYGIVSKLEPVVSKIKELKKLVEKKVADKEVKQQIDIYLDRIEKDYKKMAEIFLRSAGAGLSLSIVIHEIDKMIDELKKTVKKEKASERVIKLVQHLSRLIEGYTLIIQKSKMDKYEIKKLIDQAIFNMEYRFNVHNIEVISNYSGNDVVGCTRNLVIASIMNIFDNSIWWLEYGKINNKKIFITVANDIPGYITIIIADNGKGFTLPVGEITKPFVSAKTYGMGLGLHIADEVMKAHKGKLLFPESNEFEIPEEFRMGAIVALVFKKETEG